MGLAAWWERHGVPRAIRMACGTKPVARLRREVVPLARGDVFELGCGGGLNQSLYDPAAVTSFAGVDPGEKLLDYAREEAARKGWPADIRQGVGEAIPFADASFDTAVCTFTLCSVDDPARVLAEMHRILRPGGRLLFLEHGRAPDAGVARWQDRLEPIWKPLAGGCHLTRDVTANVERAGFAIEPMGARYAPGTPRFVGWMEWGTGVKQVTG